MKSITYKSYLFFLLQKVILFDEFDFYMKKQHNFQSKTPIEAFFYLKKKSSSIHHTSLYVLLDSKSPQRWIKGKKKIEMLMYKHKRYLRNQ